MKKRRRLVGLTVLLAVALSAGFLWFSLTSQDDDVVVLEGTLGTYQLITRKQAFAKPKIDVKLPWGSRIVWPKPHEHAQSYAEYFRSEEGVAAILRMNPNHYLPSSYFPSSTFEVDGTLIEEGLSAPIPYVYGDEPKVLRYRPETASPWFTLKVPANGKKLPPLAPSEIKLDRYTLKVQALEPFFTNLPSRARVEVLGGRTDEEFAVRLDFTFSDGPVRCGSKPGMVLYDYVFSPEMDVQLKTLKKEIVKLQVSEKMVGPERHVTIHDHHGHKIMSVIVNGSSTSASGDWVCHESKGGGYFELEGDKLNSLPAVRQNRSFMDFDLIRQLKPGPMEVIFYSVQKEFGGQITLNLPDLGN